MGPCCASTWRLWPAGLGLPGRLAPATLLGLTGEAAQKPLQIGLEGVASLVEHGGSHALALALSVEELLGLCLGHGRVLDPRGWLRDALAGPRLVLVWLVIVPPIGRRRLCAAPVLLSLLSAPRLWLRSAATRLLALLPLLLAGRRGWGRLLAHTPLIEGSGL